MKYNINHFNHNFLRSITVYGCFFAGLICLAIFTALTWYVDKTKNATEDTSLTIHTSGIRLTVYLITATLATASALISLIDVNESNNNVIPVMTLSLLEIFYNFFLFESKHDDKRKEKNHEIYFLN